MVMLGNVRYYRKTHGVNYTWYKNMFLTMCYMIKIHIYVQSYKWFLKFIFTDNDSIIF